MTVKELIKLLEKVLDKEKPIYMAIKGEVEEGPWESEYMVTIR